MPELLQILADIRARKIQMVVVYKVDRLSRSIIDFHKMMQEFDKYGCHFVSIPQNSGGYFRIPQSPQYEPQGTYEFGGRGNGV